MGFDGIRLLGVSMHVLQKARVFKRQHNILIKSKAFNRARKVDALPVPQVGKAEMCL